MLVSQYNHILVVLSFVVAILAAYTALNMAARVAGSQGVAARVWLAGGGIAMGIGRVGHAFYRHAGDGPLHEHALQRDPDGAIHGYRRGPRHCLRCGSLADEQLRLRRLLPGALVMGCGIVAMHYTGMAALEVSPGIIWDKTWVAISVVIALAASLAALWLTFRLRHEASQVSLMRLAARRYDGIAIAGMHYAGMKAAQFPMSTMTHHEGINGSWLAVLVSVVALSILGITLLVSMLDARLQARTSLLASSLAEANRELAQLALQDTLTRLPNRVLLEDRLDQAISKADREGTHFALMFMDLDGFKTINDAYGHDVGDRLLVAVTQRLLTPLKGQFTLARIGGDEFVLLAEGEGPMMRPRWQLAGSRYR